MLTQEMFDSFSPLWNDINHTENFPAVRPLLAHYTSIGNLEAIVKGEEIWFSNPLFMNDTEEVRFGIREGASAFYNSEQIKTACGTDERYRILTGCFHHYYNAYENDHVFDTYVFSLSRHEADQVDGRLSMWRGYGGNGHGVAIVFDSALIEFKDKGSPLIVSKVEYMKPSERRIWISKK